MKKLVAITSVLTAFLVINTASGSRYNWRNMVLRCEARGVPDPWYANTGNGYYFGPQFDPGTWHRNHGGPVREMGDKHGRPMHSYSIKYIIRIAENTMRNQGPGAWPNCHIFL